MFESSSLRKKNFNFHHAKTTTKKAPRMANAKNPTKISIPELPPDLGPLPDLKLIMRLASLGVWRLTCEMTHRRFLFEVSGDKNSDW